MWWLFLTALVLWMLNPDCARAQDASRGLLISLSNEAQEPVQLYTRSYALVIGIDDYKGAWGRLTNAVKDAEKVAAALKAQDFDVRLVTDPKKVTKEALIGEFEDFFIRKGAEPNARLVFWFAGHGHSISRSDVDREGYIIPIDAAKPSEEVKFKLSSISLRRFNEYLHEARAKHILTVFDSCFSGTAFKVTRAAVSPAIERATTLNVRQFITSGNAGQTVLDDGKFRSLFVEAISGDDMRADGNADGFVTGRELGLFLQNEITNATNKKQTPLYGSIGDGNEDSGDTVFVTDQERIVRPVVNAPISDNLPHFCCTAIGKLGPYPNTQVREGEACYGTHPQFGAQLGKACY